MTGTTIGINGMAHVICRESICVGAGFLRQALARPGHDAGLRYRQVVFYCVGARTAIGIQPAGPAHDGDRFVQSRVGLHHLCLRARSREDVDRLHELLRQIGATVSKPRRREHGRRVTIRCCSRTPTASVWKQTSSQARACFNQT